MSKSSVSRIAQRSQLAPPAQLSLPRLVLRRTAQGMYALSGMGLLTTITAAFSAQLSILAIVAGVATSLMVASLGLVSELLAASLRRQSND